MMAQTKLKYSANKNRGGILEFIRILSHILELQATLQILLIQMS